uniref:Spike protein n=1 Tax=Guangdong chinese water snake torovirus TaxID=2116383 RepID=A0A2P1GNP0_9NIDO|nr:spike protein [Guangdong chinese water snake torovirus]
MNILIYSLLIPVVLSSYPDWDKNILARNATNTVTSAQQLGTLLHDPHPIENIKLPRQLQKLEEMLLKYNLYSKTQINKTNAGFKPKSHGSYPGIESNVVRGANVTYISTNSRNDTLYDHPNQTFLTIDNEVYLDPRQHLAIRTFRNKTHPDWICEDPTTLKYTINKLSNQRFAVDLKTGYSVPMHKLDIPVQYKVGEKYPDFKRFKCAEVKCNQTLRTEEQKKQQYDFKVFRCNPTTVSESYTTYSVTADKKVETLYYTCSSPTGCITVLDAKPILTIVDNVIVDAPATSTDINYLRQVAFGYAQSLSNHVWYCPKWSRPLSLDFAYKTNKNKGENYESCHYKPIKSNYRHYQSGAFQPQSPTNNLRFYYFTSSVEFTYFAPLGPMTIPYIYAAKPKQQRPLIVSFGTPTSFDYTPPMVVMLGNQRFVDFGVVNGTQTYGPDPQFVSNQATLLPTKGSCKYKSGYFFRGSFEIVDESTVPLCGPADHLPTLKTCYSEKLQPDRLTVFAQKKLWMPPVSCITLCTNPLKCETSETVSPYYQACLLIAAQINDLTGNSGAPAGIPVDSALTSYVFNVTKYVNFTQEVIKVKEQSAIRPLNNAIKKMDALRQKLIPIRGGGPIATNPSPFLDIWGEGQYNSDSDMNWVAALPWLAGWRYGRQINTLNYAMKSVVDALADYVPTLNKNFQYVTEILTSVSSQATNNYKSITQLYDNFRSSYSDLTREINNIKLQMSRDQYMAAKVATLNNLYTQVVSAKSTIETDIKLFAIRRDQCRSKEYGCTGGSGTYLFHSEVETEDYLQLIISYLRPVNCSFLYQTSSFCLYDTLYVPPFPCIIQAEKIPRQPTDLNYINMTDGKPCQLDTIKIKGCDQTPEFTDAVKLVNLFDKDIVRSNVTLTNIEFNQKIGNITGFFSGVSTLVSQIDLLRDPAQYFNDTITKYYDAIFGNSNNWSFWDYLKIAIVVLIVLILLPIIIPIIQSCFFCCRR